MATDLAARSNAFQDAPRESWSYMTALYDMRPCDDRDEFAERLESGWNVLQVAESDNSIGSVVGEPEKHNQIMDGLLFKALTRPNSAQECFTSMSLNTRDLFRHVIGTLNQLINEKLHRLQRGPLEMLIWLIGELMKNGVDGMEDTWYWLLRRLHGGDLSDQNLRLAAACLRHLELYQEWLAAHDSVVVYAVFKFMRLVLDHTDNRYSSLRNSEVKFCTYWIHRRFDLIMPAGKEFVRFLLQVRIIPEFDEIWQALLHNPRSLHADFSGIESIINHRTPQSEIHQRILPLMVPFEVEQKLKFMLRRIPASPPKILQDWFLRLHLSRPESESLRADIFRLVVVAIHPSNDVLRSEAIKRWQFLTTLLTGCTTPVHTQLCMLALFFDWLDCVEKTLYIMLMEPAMLMINYNLERNAKLSFTLLDFIIRLSLEFYPPMASAMMNSVQTAFRYCQKMGVVSNLFPIFNIAHPLVDSRLRLLMKTHFMPFIDPMLLANETIALENADNDTNSSEPTTPTALTNASGEARQNVFSDDVGNDSIRDNNEGSNALFSDASEESPAALADQQQHRQKFVDDPDDFENEAFNDQQIASSEPDLAQNGNNNNDDEQFMDTNDEGAEVSNTADVVPPQSSNSNTTDEGASYWMTDDEDIKPNALDDVGHSLHDAPSHIASRSSVPTTVVTPDPIVGSLLDKSGQLLSQELIHSLNMHSFGFAPQITGPDSAAECVALARRIASIKRACTTAFVNEPAKVAAEDAATANLVVDSFCAAYQSTPYLTLCAQLAVVSQTDLVLCRVMRLICAHLAREKFPAEIDGEDTLNINSDADDAAADAEVDGFTASSSTSLTRKTSSRSNKRRKLTTEAAAAIQNVECIGTMCGEIIVDRFYSQMERSAREQATQQALTASAPVSLSSPTNTCFVQSAILPLVMTSDSMRRSIEKPWFIPMRMLFDWGTPEEDKWNDLYDASDTDSKNLNNSAVDTNDASADDDILKLPNGPQTERILQRFLAVMSRRFPLLRVLHLYYLKFRRDLLPADDERDVTVDYENFSEECALLTGQIDSRGEFSNVSLETALYQDLAMCAATDAALFGHLLPFVCRELFAVFRNDAKMVRLIVRNCDSAQVSQLCCDIALSISATNTGGTGGRGGRGGGGDEDPDAMLLFSVIHPKPQQAFQAVVRQSFDWSPQEQTFLWDLLDAHQHISTTEILKGFLHELRFPAASQMVFLLAKRLKRDITSTLTTAAVSTVGQFRLPSDVCLRLVLAERRFVGFDAVLYSIIRNWCDSKLEQATALAEAVAQLFETLVTKSVSWNSGANSQSSNSSASASRRGGRTISQSSSTNDSNSSSGTPHFTELENLLHNLDAVYCHYRTKAYGGNSGRASSSLQNFRLPVTGGEPIIARFFANDRLINKAALHAYRNVDAKLRTTYRNLFEFLLHTVPRHMYEDIGNSVDNDAVAGNAATGFEVAEDVEKSSGKSASGNTTRRGGTSGSRNNNNNKTAPDTIELISDDENDIEVGGVDLKSEADDSDYLSRTSSRNSTTSTSSSTSSKRDANNSTSAGPGASSASTFKKRNKSSAAPKKPAASASVTAPPTNLKQTTLTTVVKKRAGAAPDAAATVELAAGSSKHKKRKKVADSDEEDIQFM